MRRGQGQGPVSPDEDFGPIRESTHLGRPIRKICFFFLHQEKDIPFLGSAVLCPLPWQVDSGLDSAIFHPSSECLRAEHNLQSGYVVILSRDTLYKVLIGEYG